LKFVKWLIEAYHMYLRVLLNLNYAAHIVQSNKLSLSAFH